MLPFRRFKVDATALSMCVDAIEDTVAGIRDCINTDKGKADSLMMSLDALDGVFDGLTDDLSVDVQTVSPRLHFNAFPKVMRSIRDSCRRRDRAFEGLAEAGAIQEGLSEVEAFANGEEPC